MKLKLIDPYTESQLTEATEYKINSDSSSLIEFGTAESYEDFSPNYWNVEVFNFLKTDSNFSVKISNGVNTAIYIGINSDTIVDKIFLYKSGSKIAELILEDENEKTLYKTIYIAYKNDGTETDLFYDIHMARGEEHLDDIPAIVGSLHYNDMFNINVMRMYVKTPYIEQQGVFINSITGSSYLFGEIGE